MSASTLHITLPYADLTEFVARFRMVTEEGIGLPSPFARKVGDSVRFVVRLLDRSLVLEGAGVVMDVTDNGRGSNPDSRYDLAIAFTEKTPTTEVMIERLVMAQEFDTTEPTGMRKAPPEQLRPSAPAPHAVPPPVARPVAAPAPKLAAPPPIVRERVADGDLLEEIDEEDMLTPPPRVLPRAPEPVAPRARPETPRPSSPPPLPSRGAPIAAPVPSALRPSAPAPRPSSPPARPSSPPERPSSPPAPRPAAAPAPGPTRPSAPPSTRSSVTPLPPSPSASAPAPAPAPRTAPPRRRTAPGTGDAMLPADLRVKTEVDRLPSFDTQTDVRRTGPTAPAASGPARMPVPTRAAPTPRTLTGGAAPLPAARAVIPTVPAAPVAPPRRKTGQRKALEMPAEPEPPRAPPRKKTIPGAGDPRAHAEGAAPPRRKTGTGRVVAEPAPAPPRRKTGQRRAVDPDDVTQQTVTRGREDDTDRAPLPPSGRK